MLSKRILLPNKIQKRRGYNFDIICQKVNFVLFSDHGWK